MKIKNERGFSLIELMYVMMLIGIIASTAIPTFREFKSRAYDATAESDLNTIWKALHVEDNASESDRTYTLINRSGPGPAATVGTLAAVGLSNGVTAQLIIKFPNLLGSPLLYTSIAHENGSHQYIWLEWGNLNSKTEVPL